MYISFECRVLSGRFSATGRSLGQRNLSICAVSMCVSSKTHKKSGLGPSRAVKPSEEK